VFDRRGHIGKFSIVLLPLLIAALIGVTRVDDYWHHWTDVFTGGLIGQLSCYVWYHTRYIKITVFHHNFLSYA
jgi:membrane-associated phospholipid phosphatase